MNTEINNEILVSKIDELLKERSNFNLSFENANQAHRTEFINKLSYYRAQGSSSLKRITKFNSQLASENGDCFGQFIANSLIERFIKNNSVLSITNICKINYALLCHGLKYLSNSTTYSSSLEAIDLIDVLSDDELLSTIRKQQVFVGDYKCYQPDKIINSLKNAINYFNYDYNLCIQQSVLEYFIKIAKLQNAIIRIHPFPNGNGRVATLLGDWFLIKEGFLPQSFRNKYDFLVGDLDNKFQNDSCALEKNITQTLITNVYRSYQLYA